MLVVVLIPFCSGSIVKLNEPATLTFGNQDAMVPEEVDNGDERLEI
jgi:hypothetical protein